MDTNYVWWFLLVLSLVCVVYLLRGWLVLEGKNEIYKTPSYGYQNLSTEVDKYWVDFETMVSVHGLEIKNGMFYFGNNLEAERTAGCMEPSLIDPSLAVETNCPHNSESFFPDYPYYRFLKPYQRYQYLSWLSEKSSLEDTHVNIIRLYLYGIERRLISDFYRTEMCPREITELIDEIRRIKSEVSDTELSQQISQLIDWSVYLHEERIRSRGYTPSSSESPTLFRYRFSKKSVNEGITSEEALEWVVYNDPDIVPEFMSSHAEYFKYHFREIFDVVYPDGIKMSPSEVPMHLCYKPMHPGISPVDIFLKRHPDPKWPSVHDHKLRGIFTKSSEQTLSMLEGFIEYESDPLYQLRVAQSLPGQLQFNPEIQPFKKIYTFFSSLVSSDEPIVYLKVMDLISFLSSAQFHCEEGKLLDSNQLVYLENMLTHIGLSMVPSPKLFEFQYKFDDVIGIYLCNDRPVISEYSELAVLVTILDGLCGAVRHCPDITVKRYINSVKSSWSTIGPGLVDAMCGWVDRTTTPSRNMNKRIGTLETESKDIIYEISVDILRKGRFPKEFKGKLLAIYKIVGRDQKELNADIERLPIRLN